MEISGNIVIGKPDVEPSKPSHTSGVREGNQRTSLMREPGVKHAGRFMAVATPRRSTGINAKAEQPIDPRMPVLTPA
jgi:hypothetical protein